MQDLRVIGVENGALLVASDDGTRYRVAIDEVLQAKLRQAIPDPAVGKKLAPKDIQAHIRSGMSAQDVASITGVPLDYIQKFEGPVLAEREFVVGSALAVPVHTAEERDPLGGGSTFGTVIRERLYDLGAINERWASWKEVGGGWIVKLAFTAEQIDHDARWSFDPKKSALSPLNSEAITLSQQGDPNGALIPRLRAVGDEERLPDQSRFDSGAFSDDELDRSDGSRPDSVPYGRLDDAPTAVSDAAINRAPAAEDVESNQTADLLEALRRRRGERESANFDDDESMAAHPSTGSIRLVDVPLDFGGDDEDARGDTAPQPSAFAPKPAGKKGRTTMPSWDEIVFGARSDDDL
ncbi:MAG TPA: septation protein SepH [Lacisediminihabitans sp.]|uniref:septation protein SepH n=1 Tax=Lacisediminihabitans sp. TaxID=2787631 RepID=UPI002ED7A7CB